MTLLAHLEASAERFAREIASAARDVEVEVMNTVGAGLAELREEVTEFARGLGARTTTHPEAVFSLLRTLQPVLLRGNYALVTRAPRGFSPSWPERPKKPSMACEASSRSFPR